MVSIAGSDTRGETLETRYEIVRERIAEAAQRSGRTAKDVMLVAVTKNAEPEDIRRLMALGHEDFGENRVQQLGQRAAMSDEWLERVRVLRETEGGRHGSGGEGSGLRADQLVRWHMIGHLQRNKARKIVDLVRLVHSVDSLRLAEELQTLLRKTDRRLDVLLQVNISAEDSKHGCLTPAVPAMVEQIESMYSIRLRGLMTMAPQSADPEQSRHHFRRCRELYEEVKAAGAGDGAFNMLSMGMSGDYEIAIEEGSNVVRVGSALFSGGNASDETQADET